jgi:subtilisin family serine protease
MARTVHGNVRIFFFKLYGLVLASSIFLCQSIASAPSSSGILNQETKLPDPGSLKLNDMLSWLSSQTKIELMERGQKRVFQLALDEFIIETNKELTPTQAESLVKILVPGGKLLGQQVSYLLVQPPLALNPVMVADMIRLPRLSTVEELKTIKSLCPVLYPEDETDRQGKIITSPRTDFTRRIVTSQVVVQMVSEVSKNSLSSILNAFSGINLGANPLASNMQSLDFGNGFQALSATLDMQRDSGMVVHPQIAIQQAKKATPNDTNFPAQWHINDSSTGNINVQKAWDSYTGTGLSISIVDDGLQLNHEDLDANTPVLGGDISTSFHWDFNGNDNDPTPTTSDDGHGTACAGLAGAVWQNSLGVAGVAPLSTLLGIRLIAGPSTDTQEATALGWAKADVSSNSWGPADTALLVAGPGPLTEAALLNAVTSGRGGKGTVIVFAGGNGDNIGVIDGEIVADYSTYDGYAGSPYVIAVGATKIDGTKTSYSEKGSNLLISAPGGEGVNLISTTDLTGADGYSPSNYTTQFNGTSAATPIVSGVVALMLQANPNLGWRDVKEILIKTAVKNDASDTDWVTNGAGYHFNHKYGAGLVDAKKAVDEALIWKNLGAMSSSSQTKPDLALAIPDGNPIGVTVNFDPIAELNNMRVETVLVTVDLTHTYRGDLTFKLISPSGVKSVLAETRLDSVNNLTWTFSTTHHWGEDSVGTWSLVVADEVVADVGTLKSASIKFLGVSAPILGPPTFSVSPSYPIAESAGSAAIAVNRSGSLDSAVTVDYVTADIEALNGSDYTGTPVATKLNFAIGESSKTVTIPILNEDDEEPAERFSLTLSNPTGGGPDPGDVAVLGTSTVCEVTISANDSSLVHFENVFYSMFEGQLVANVVVERFRNLDNWAYVSFQAEDGTATQGVDYLVQGRRVLFLPGQSTTVIPLQLISDGSPEGFETMKMHLSSPNAGLDLSVTGGTTDIDVND